jgi:hypothetical protein
MAVSAASNAAGSVASASSAVAGLTAAGSAALAVGGFAGLTSGIAAATIATKVAVGLAVVAVVAGSVGSGIALTGDNHKNSYLNSAWSNVPTMAPAMVMLCDVNERHERTSKKIIFPNIPSSALISLVPFVETTGVQ